MALEIGSYGLIRINGNATIRYTSAEGQILAKKQVGEEGKFMYLFRAKDLIGFGVEPAVPMANNEGKPIVLVADFSRQISGSEQANETYVSLGFGKEMGLTK